MRNFKKYSAGPIRGCLVKIYGALVLLAGLLASTAATALDVDGNYHLLSPEFQYLEDTAGTITIDQLLDEPSRYQFMPSKSSKPRADFAPVWLKLELNFSNSAQEKRYVLSGRVENFYDIRVYRPDGQGTYSEWVTGNNYPASSRELDTFRYGFAVDGSAEPVTLYVRYIGGPGTNNLPWDLTEEHTYRRNSQLYYHLDVACFAAIGALLIFNLIIALSLRTRAYIYYSAFLCSVTMALITLDGIGFYYLWPDYPAVNERALHSFNLVSAAMRLLAIVSFLGIAREAPRWNVATTAVLALLTATFVAVNAMGITALPPYTATIPWAAATLFGFLLCFVAIKRHIKLAIPLLLTLFIPTLAAVLQALLSVSSGHAGILELLSAKIGFVVHAIFFSLCLAAKIKIQAESHRVALHDKLTGLPQSVLLNERFEWAVNLSKRQKWKMAVLFIDLDGFKRVNDTLGHAAGDQLLVQVAARMQATLRRTDFVARIGGDEFVVLYLDTPENFFVSTVTERLLSSISKPYGLGHHKASISASIGIALYSEQNDGLPALMKKADTAMYEAKRKGKNTYVVSGEAPVLTLVAGAGKTAGQTT